MTSSSSVQLQTFRHQGAASTSRRLHPRWLLPNLNNTTLPTNSPNNQFDSLNTSKCLQTSTNTCKQTKQTKQTLKHITYTQTTQSQPQFFHYPKKKKYIKRKRINNTFSWSDTELEVAMPVGTSFEHSAMKASFSLSSLQSPVGLETPEKARLRADRPYNSLTKKRKDKNEWRKSWGSNTSGSENKDEFWSAMLQANYNYIMDNHLIDSCKEANGDLNRDHIPWSLKELYLQFSELYSWLNSIQEAVYGREENLTDRTLRAFYMEELQSKSHCLKTFNEQASKFPELRDEIVWRVMSLNSKWESVESSLSPSECSKCELDTCIDIDNEVKCLRKWIKEMETRLQPLSFAQKWSKSEIEEKALEHLVLHRDIENHGKIVSSIVKLCRRSDAGCVNSSARRVASGLERRWHLLFLRSLEWQCHIETLAKRSSYRNQDSPSGYSDSDCDEGPANKQPRLSDRFDSTDISSSDEGSYFEDDVVTTLHVSNLSSNEEGCKMVKSNALIGNKNCYEIDNDNDIALNMATPSSFASSADDSTKFTTSKRKAKNCGTFYFKHIDTDSDMDKSKELAEIQEKTNQQEKPETIMDESSEEDDWVYEAGDKNETLRNGTKDLLEGIQPLNTNGTDMIDGKSPRAAKDILRLVLEAEELVRDSPGKKPKSRAKISTEPIPSSKISRVKEWLNMEKPVDSCDASGEDDERDSQSSEDQNESIATYRAMNGYASQNTSITDLDGGPVTPDQSVKVNLRAKRTDWKGSRPWSVSCISQLAQNSPSTDNDNLANFSISESALHQLTTTSTPQQGDKTLTASATSIGIQGTNSTSSTVEDCGGITYTLEGKLVPMRRKKLRSRKKHNYRKNEPGSPYQSTPKRKMTPLGTLVKSGSFSGCSSKLLSSERNTASDPSVASHGGKGGNCETSTTSGAETDEERRIRTRLPDFKIGARTSIFTESRRDSSSPGKSSLNTPEEQSSSLSEQAWDSYQEKYLSEAYSEAQDSDAARRLLEFGEDYRNFLDSQSDCWSNQSTNPDCSPSMRRKTLSATNLDSDSDVEDVKHLLNESKQQLCYTAEVYNRYFAMGLDEYLLASDCGEIIATCDRHIYCLEVIVDAQEEHDLPQSDVEEAADLIPQWQNLKMRANKMQELRNLQKEIISLKSELASVNLPVPLDSLVVRSIEELKKDIEIYTAELVNIEEQKKKLLQVNVAVHRFITENKDYHISNLKADVSELYSLWYDVHTCASERVTQLNSLLQVWQMLETRLDELQGDLHQDEHRLRLLDSALQGGAMSSEVATSVRDVAKLLSESQPSDQSEDVCPDGLMKLCLLTEGSLSDSGISDEGSEQELSERERRLAAIRRLVRQLEAVMAPDGNAGARMSEKIAAAEEELRSLQKRCRALIVRTAVYATTSPSRPLSPSKRKKSPSQAQEPQMLASACKGDPDDDDPPKSTSWFWRVVRSSLPFQVAIVALLCVACLLEPSCCDNMNNLSLSLSPQLRYVRGPPPV